MNTVLADEKSFDLMEELHKTILQSIVTPFGLDFLLFEDKKGGNVDTIHNARQGVYASDEEKQRYLNREEYDSHKYHSNSNYIQRGKADKELQASGELIDKFTQEKIDSTVSRDLDHIISAKEIHDDAGRVLAEVDGSHIANIDSNFNSTQSSINRSKGATSIQEYTKELPEKIHNLEKKIAKNEYRIKDMPNSTAEDKHKIRNKESQIRKEKSKLKSLKSIDKNKMLRADKLARAENNRILANEYYASSKFLKNTAMTTSDTSLRMGLRESLGIVLVEIWFELREQLPQIYESCQLYFSFGDFLKEIKIVLKNICERVIHKFKDILSAFKNSAISGVFSNISTVILNTFLTTEKMIGKIIREMWSTIAKVSKLIFFNPNNLSMGSLTKQVVKLLSAGVVLAVGLVVNTHLASIMSVPFGAELAGFLSALLTGLLTLGFTYFIEHNGVMQKVWSFLDKFKTKYKIALEHFREINNELDRYLKELAKVEFNMDADELLAFSDSLVVINCEYKKSALLNKEIEKRKIDLPFEPDNANSVRGWLTSL